MIELTAPPPDPEAEPPAPPTMAPARRHFIFPALTVAGFLVLAAGLIWVWRHPAVPPTATRQTEALAQLGPLEARVARLEQRPQPEILDLGPLSSRVTALEQSPLPQGGAAPTPDLAPLERRLTALEQRQPPNIAALEASLSALDNAGRTTQADVSRRLDTIEGRLTALENASRTTQADVSRRMDAVEGRLAASEKANRRVPLVQAAALALTAGQKLGDLPGAPPALARFADAAPPTEATLRLAFPQAAREALAVSHPASEGQPLLTRLWVQAQDLVTIRQGERVLIGDPAAGVLAHARADLEAGDLAAAVADVAQLEGAAAQAMTAWLAQARSLLEARAALAAWAAAG
jgi:hypothetical protein